MKLERLMKLHGAAALATIFLYKLLGGEDTTWVAAVVCMYLWWLGWLAAAEEWIQERRKKRYGRYERDKTRSGSDRTSGKAA